MEEELHGGHRRRLRESYINAGAALHEHHLLELLLTYAIPRRDVNPLAHALIARYGSLAGVLAAPVHELMTLEGVGESTAVLLALAGTLRSFPAAKLDGRVTLNTPEEAVNYCHALLRRSGAKYETTYCVSLDKRRRVLHCDLVSAGTLSENVIYPRLIVECALRHGAHSVILTHNHPSGDPSPSRADIASTKAVYEALSSIGITLHDHIIIGREASFSMLRSMLLPSGETPETLARAAEKE